MMYDRARIEQSLAIQTFVPRYMREERETREYAIRSMTRELGEEIMKKLQAAAVLNLSITLHAPKLTRDFCIRENADVLRMDMAVTLQEAHR